MADWSDEVRVEVADELHKKGSEAYKAGKLSSAIELWSSALDVNPKALDSLNNRSLALTKSGRFVEAARDARRAIKLDPSCSKAYYRLVSALSGMGAFLEALAVVEHAEAAGASDLVEKMRRDCQGRVDRQDLVAGMVNGLLENTEKEMRASVANSPAGSAVVAEEEEEEEVEGKEKVSEDGEGLLGVGVLGEEEANGMVEAALKDEIGAEAGVEERVERSRRLQKVGRALIRGERYVAAIRVLDEGIRGLSIQGRVDPEVRKAAETAKLPLMADRSFARLCVGLVEEADEDAERVLARVSETRMGGQYILSGGKKASWDREMEELATFRSTLALAEQAEVKAARSEAEKLARLRPLDPLANKAVDMVDILAGNRAAAIKAGVLEDENEEDDEDDEDDDEDEDEDEDEGKGMEVEGEEDFLVTPVADTPMQSELTVLVVTDVAFRLSMKIAEQYVGPMIHKASGDSARVRLADWGAWKHIDWSRERFVVFLVSPLRMLTRDVERDGNSLGGFLRWLARARPPLGHLFFSSCAVGHSEYFPGFDDAERVLSVALKSNGAVGLIREPVVVDTARGQSAILLDGRDWGLATADKIVEAFRSLKASRCPDQIVAGASFDPAIVATKTGRSPSQIGRLHLARVSVDAVRDGGSGFTEVEFGIRDRTVANSFTVGDAVGIVRPNPPELVEACLSALGVSGDLQVPAPAHWFKVDDTNAPQTPSKPSAASASAEEELTLAAAARIKYTLLESDEERTPLSACTSFVEGVRAMDSFAGARRARAECKSGERGLPPPLILTRGEAARHRMREFPVPDTAPRPVVSLRFALEYLYSLAPCPPVLLEQLKLLAPDREVFAARASELPEDWKSSMTVPDLLHHFRDSAVPPTLRSPEQARNASWSARAHVAALFTTLTHLSVRILPLQSRVSIAGRDLGLAPGSSALIYRHPDAYPVDPVEQCAPHLIIAQGDAIGLARGIIFRRLQTAAVGRTILVLTGTEHPLPFAEHLATLPGLELILAPDVPSIQHIFQNPDSPASQAVRNALLHPFAPISIAIEQQFGTPDACKATLAELVPEIPPMGEPNKAGARWPRPWYAASTDLILAKTKSGLINISVV